MKNIQVSETLRIMPTQPTITFRVGANNTVEARGWLLSSEVMLWAVDRGARAITHDYGTVIYFKNEKDVTLFMLKWGS